MRLCDLIRRLEMIRDEMESTFKNEFLKGEFDNLVEELKSLSPEIGQVTDQPKQQPSPWTSPWTSPWGVGTTTGGSITLPSSSSPTYISYPYSNTTTTGSLTLSNVQNSDYILVYPYSDNSKAATIYTNTVV